MVIRMYKMTGFFVWEDVNGSVGDLSMSITEEKLYELEKRIKPELKKWLKLIHDNYDVAEILRVEYDVIKVVDNREVDTSKLLTGGDI